LILIQYFLEKKFIASFFDEIFLILQIKTSDSKHWLLSDARAEKLSAHRAKIWGLGEHSCQQMNWNIFVLF